MHKYFIKTFGCQMNFSDSERLMTLMAQNGYSPASKAQHADLVIFNTCGVRQTAEDRVYGLVHNLKTANPDIYVAVTGCLAHRPDVQRKLKGKVDLFLPIADMPQIFEHLPRQLQPDSQTSPKHYLCLSPSYKYTDIAYVPIMTGCNNFCSYCVVPYARGREWSRSLKDIVGELSQLAKNDCRKVILLGQNVNSYNHRLSKDAGLLFTDGHGEKNIIGERKVTFPRLLHYLAGRFPELNFKFLTSHPKDFSPELVKTIAANKNISKDIHLPIQSGSDRILKAMNRPYTQEHYLGLIGKAKKMIPGVRFSTDIIVGFPGETEVDFQKTADVFEKVGFFEAFINKYSPRPGTAAYPLGDPVSWSEKKRREKILRRLIRP